MEEERNIGPETLYPRLLKLEAEVKAVLEELAPYVVEKKEGITDRLPVPEVAIPAVSKATITKEITLTPADVAQAIREFTPEERAEVQALLEKRPPEEESPLWALIDLEPLPQEPPHTAEGDLVALAAADRLYGMFEISDPELARWIAESPELSMWGG